MLISPNGFLRYNKLSFVLGVLLLSMCVVHMLYSLQFLEEDGQFTPLIHFRAGHLVPLCYIGVNICLIIITSITIGFKILIMKNKYLSDCENDTLRSLMVVSLVMTVAGYVLVGLAWHNASLLHRRAGGLLLTALLRYNHDIRLKSLIDRAQINYQCCGVNSYKDWFNYTWYKVAENEDKEENLLNEPIQLEHVPFSCCSSNVLVPCIHHRLTSSSHGYKLEKLTIYEDGCLPVMTDKFTKRFTHLTEEFASLLLVFILQIIGERVLQTTDASFCLEGKMLGYIFRQPHRYRIQDAIVTTPRAAQHGEYLDNIVLLERKRKRDSEAQRRMSRRRMIDEVLLQEQEEHAWELREEMSRYSCQDSEEDWEDEEMRE